MAKALKDLLSNDHPLFMTNIAQLERATGNAGIDARLIGEILEKGHRIMRHFGLDPADTTSKELYQTLNAAMSRGDEETKHLLDDAAYVLVNRNDGPISLNIRDISQNVKVPYEQRSVAYAQRALRTELIKRYAEHERTHDDAVHGLAREAGILLDNDKIPMIDRESDQKGEAMKPYMLAVGDINTNAFIKMNESYGEVITDDKGYKRLSIELGGKIPYDEVDIVRAGECSPNAAVSMTRLGLHVDLMTWLGDDEAGEQMIEYLKSEGVGTDYMVVEKGYRSNYHYVLRFGSDRTKLQRFEDYSYAWREPVKAPDWIYLGVLGEKTWPLHEDLMDYLNRNLDIKLVFQPGMYHLMWGAKKLAAFYRRAEIVVMNREEAMQVTGLPHDSVRHLANGLHDLGVKIVVITDGPNGSYASYGGKLVTIPNYPDPAPPLDRTGAGDAFASTVVAALALGEPMETALTWAPINSAYVVQQIGAQKGLLTHQGIQRHLADAPADYKVTELRD